MVMHTYSICTRGYIVSVVIERERDHLQYTTCITAYCVVIGTPPFMDVLSQHRPYKKCVGTVGIDRSSPIPDQIHVGLYYILFLIAVSLRP